MQCFDFSHLVALIRGLLNGCENKAVTFLQLGINVGESENSML